MRFLHSYLGLAGLTIVGFLAISGLFLSFQPALETLNTHQASSETSVGELATRVATHLQNIERLERKASGAIIAHVGSDQGPLALVIEPLTGQAMAEYKNSPFFSWIAELHREMLIVDIGRLITGIGAALMLILSLSGILLIKRRFGRWRNVISPSTGGFTQRLHVELGRAALPGLLISSITGLYMSFVSLGLVSGGQPTMPPFPDVIAQGERAPVGSFEALNAVSVGNLRELVYPFPDDPQDPFTLTTNRGTAYIDPATGINLAFVSHSAMFTLYEWIYLLHSGQGAWVLGLLLGLSAMTIPALSLTGIWIWWKKAIAAPTRQSTSLANADHVVLVGSEGQTTWQFANTLSERLEAKGQCVHCAEMNAVTAAHLKDKQVYILTSTYGNGQAPQTANRFLGKLAKLDVNSAKNITVLGFGDRAFSNFCQFAKDVETTVRKDSIRTVVPLHFIDKQSVTEFVKWGTKLGDAMGLSLDLGFEGAAPETNKWRLVSREVYGAEFEEPTMILRFKANAPQSQAAFETGDLIGIVAADGVAPRYYSLASSSKDGYLEICVKRHRRGLCSTFLHHMAIDDVIDGFIKPNPEFKPNAAQVPKILIGAGTGIAPLAGFARSGGTVGNTHLYWGGRHPQSDFLFRDDLITCSMDGRLAGLKTAFSRVSNRQYVQDKIREDASLIRSLIQSGGQILICGGQAMERDVQSTLDDILRPLGLNVEGLKQSKRYLKDVY